VKAGANPDTMREQPAHGRARAAAGA